jgi:hypothetical protein
MVKNEKGQIRRMRCPYCDQEIFEMKLPICSACHVELIYCSECKQPLPKNAKKCPNCGAQVKSR